MLGTDIDNGVCDIVDNLVGRHPEEDSVAVPRIDLHHAAIRRCRARLIDEALITEVPVPHTYFPNTLVTVCPKESAARRGRSVLALLFVEMSTRGGASRREVADHPHASLQLNTFPRALPHRVAGRASDPSAVGVTLCRCVLQAYEVAKIEKAIKKKEMTVRKFEKKWVPHGHIMVYKWVTDTKRDGEDDPPAVPNGPLPGDYNPYGDQMQSMRQMQGGGRWHNTPHTSCLLRSSLPPSVSPIRCRAHLEEICYGAVVLASLGVSCPPPGSPCGPSLCQQADRTGGHRICSSQEIARGR